MATLIYFLATVVGIGFFTSIVLFFKFFVLFFSLTETVGQTAKRDIPMDLYVTGGLLSLFRVLSWGDNKTANQRLVKSGVFFALSFAITIGAGFLFLHLNKKHCVVSMSEVTADDGKNQICP